MSFPELDEDYFSKERIAPMSSDKFFYKGDYRDMSTDDDDDPELEEESNLTSVGIIDPTTSSTDTSTDDKRYIFPFFELPGELRNHIYDDCIADTELVHSSTISGVQIIVQDNTITHLLLVCRQFQEEFKARQPRIKTAVLTQHTWLDMGLDLANFTVPTFLLQFDKIKLRLISAPNHFWGDVRLLKPGLAHLLRQLATAQQAALCWVVTGTWSSGKSWDGTDWVKIFDGIMTTMKEENISKALKVKVCRGWQKVDDGWVTTSRSKAKIRWSSETGEMEVTAARRGEVGSAKAQA